MVSSFDSSRPTSSRGILTRRLGNGRVPAARFLGGLLGLRALDAVYDQVCRDGGIGEFCERALACLNITWSVPDEELSRIPKSGPLVVVANHPFGGVEGLILTALLRRVRPDVKVLANFLLAAIPQMQQSSIFVDPFGSVGARVRNIRPLREAVRWLRDGGALGVFPAGEVAHLIWREGGVAEPPWSDDVTRMIRLTRASVLPVYFEGRNGPLFQFAGLVHPRLRTILLPRQLLNKRNRRLRLRVGHSIPFSHSERFESPRMLADYLRLRTLLLSPTAKVQDRGTARGTGRGRKPLAEIADPLPPEDLAEEVARLRESERLLQGGGFDVLCARAERIPMILREIGRLRETAFRLVGEGTGRAADLDAFDEHYQHLFVWNRARREIIGAYRMGLADEILDARGVEGLYTWTLFRFGRRLLERFGPAIELGRSFVVPAYQRNYAPLLLLWRGIGRFISLHPRYRVLFGAVSISAEYDSMTKRLLMAFLREHHFAPDLALLASPRNPPRFGALRRQERQLLTSVVTHIDEMDDLMRQIDMSQRGMPILLREYLKLNGRLMGFSVDPSFGHVLDGLFYVDLMHVAPELLQRYMGGPAAAAFLAAHGRPSRVPAQSAS